MAQISYGTITITDTTDIEFTIEYARNQSTSSPPAQSSSDWSTTRPAWAQGYYIWQRTRIHKYGTAASEDTFSTAICLSGSTGETGQSLTATKTQYTHVADNITITTQNHTSYTWTDNVPTYDSTKPAYWGRITNTYSNPSKTEYIVYKDNGITDSIGKSAAADEKATNALSTSQQTAAKVKNFWWDSSGAHVASGKNGNEVTADTISTYGYHGLMGLSGISFNYDNATVVDLNGSNTPSLNFYQPPTINGSTVTQGNKTMMLSANALKFYNPNNGTTEQAVLDSNGLVLKEGGIKSGSVNAGNSGFIYLSTKNYGSNLTINGHQASNWREVIGTKFGVDADGNLYASNADISGKIVASDGEIGGFVIDSSSIHTKNVLITSNADNSVGLSSSTFTRTINNISRDGLKLAIGSKFGVKNDGTLYASNADISGKITVGSGSNVSTTDEMNSAIGDAIDDIEIGGRNYATLASRFGQENITNGGTTKVLSDSTIVANGTFTATTLVLNTTILTGVQLEAGTYQLWATNPNFCHFRLGTTTSGTYWKEGDYSKDSPCKITVSTSQYVTIGITVSAGTYSNEATQIMLEKGTMVTDWTPAPEDVQAEIDAKKSVHTLTTTYSQPYASILVWAAEGFTSNWTVTEGTSGIKIGDTVRFKCTVNNMNNAPVYVVGTVSAINSSTNLTAVSHGLDTTIIDGGNIIANSIGANQLDANNINVSNKLTIGALSTDTQSSILNSNVQIGGTNLIPLSRNLKSFTVENVNYGPVTFTNVDCYLAVTASNTSRYGLYKDWGVDASTTYTLSFKCSSVAGTINIGIGNRTGSAEGWNDIVGYKQLVSGLNTVTFTTPSDVTKIRIYIGGQNGSHAYIWKLKLEKGNKATDWSPAVDDMAGAKYLTSTYSNPYSTYVSWVNRTTPDTYSVTSSSGVNVGDIVYIECNCTTTNAKLYVMGEVESIPKDTQVTIYPLGIVDRATYSSKTATTYITDISGTGIQVHPASGTDDRVAIDGNGVAIYKGGSLRATYGDTVTLQSSNGTYPKMTVSSSEAYFQVSSTDWATMNGSGFQVVKGNSNVLSINGGTSARIGISNSERVELKSDGVYIYNSSNTQTGYFGSFARVGEYSSNNVKMSSSGVDINSSEDNSVANFGSTVTIGQSSKSRVYITPENGMRVYDKNNKRRVWLDWDGFFIYDDSEVQMSAFTPSYARIGQAASGHSTVKSDGLHVWTGTESTASNEVAFFGSTITIGQRSKTQIYVNSTGADAGIKFITQYKDTNNTVKNFYLGDIGFDSTSGWTNNPTVDKGYFPVGAWATFGIRTINSFKGYYSFVSGFNNIASHNASVSFGIQNKVYAPCGFAMGMDNVVGDSTKTSANSYSTSNIGNCSTAIGYGLQTGNATDQFICGRYNKIDTNCYFIVGGGYLDSRFNSFVVTKNGRVQTTANGYESNQAQTSVGIQYSDGFREEIWMGVGSGGDNKGLYDPVHNQWILFLKNTGSTSQKISTSFGGFSTTSDLKRKNIIGPIDYATDFIMSLKPKQYYWKDDKYKKINLGFVAQEVDQIGNKLNLDLNIALAQYKDKSKGEYHGGAVDDSELEWYLDYNEIIAPLVQVVQDQQKEIEQLKQEVQNLKNK